MAWPGVEARAGSSLAWRCKQARVQGGHVRCDASKEPPARSRRPLLVGRYSAVCMPAAAGASPHCFDSISSFFFETQFDLVADWDWD